MKKEQSSGGVRVKPRGVDVRERGETWREKVVRFYFGRDLI